MLLRKKLVRVAGSTIMPGHGIREGSTQQAGRASSAADVMPRFARDEGFRRHVTRRVDGYFEANVLSPHADWRMYVKASVALAWFAASYVLLVFVAATWWQAALSALSLALATAAVGFNIQHDANHGALSKSGTVNHVLGFTLDMLGASSYLWRAKHNVFHHT
jgi:linoleoyl-CoA desaturase